MKFQNVYETNIDYERSYEKLCQKFPGVEVMPKGSIRFRLSPYDMMVLISPKGKIQVAWSSSQEKDHGLELLKNSLVSDGGEVAFKPRHQNILKIPYPSPETIHLLWCNRGVRYVREKMDAWPLISIGLAFFGFLILCAGFADPSLRILNDTIVNPLRAVPGSTFFFPLIILLSFAWYVLYFIEKRK